MKAKVTLTVDEDLVRRAKQAGIPLSATLEQQLETVLRSVTCPLCKGTGKVYKK